MFDKLEERLGDKSAIVVTTLKPAFDLIKKFMPKT
jgi:hypothetical protein